jgi:hypothetical protein
MLTIRREQTIALQEDAAERFVKRMAALLRDRYPVQPLPQADYSLYALIRLGISDCERFELLDAAEVEAYLDYLFRFGPDFTRCPETRWALTILSDPGLFGMEKLERLDQYELFELEPRLKSG